MDIETAKMIGGKMDRLEVIKKIEGIANFWDASIQCAAMAVIKEPDNTALMETAQRLLIKSDERKAMGRQVIDVIDEGWPIG